MGSSLYDAAEESDRLLQAIALHSNGICDGPACSRILPKHVRQRPVRKTQTTIHASSTRQVVMDVYAVSVPTRPGYQVMAVLYVKFNDGEQAYGTDLLCRKCVEAIHPEILEALTGPHTDWV